MTLLNNGSCKQRETGNCSSILKLVMYGVSYGSDLSKFSNFENPDFQFSEIVQLCTKGNID